MSNRRLIRRRIRHLERGYMIASPKFHIGTRSERAVESWLKRQVIEGRA